jgi:flagellar basal body-associated protein FliL
MKQSSINTLIAVLVLLISLAAIIVGWVLAGGKKAPAPKEKEMPAYLKIDKEISTAMNGQNRGSVIVKLDVEIKDQKTLQKAKAWEPLITTEISSYLSRRTFEELEGPDNMVKVSEGMKEHLNQSMRSAGASDDLKDAVKSILFSKYIVQN